MRIEMTALEIALLVTFFVILIVTNLIGLAACLYEEKNTVLRNRELKKFLDEHKLPYPNNFEY